MTFQPFDTASGFRLFNQGVGSWIQADHGSKGLFLASATQRRSETLWVFGGTWSRTSSSDQTCRRPGCCTRKGDQPLGPASYVGSEPLIFGNLQTSCICKARIGPPIKVEDHQNTPNALALFCLLRPICYRIPEVHKQLAKSVFTDGGLSPDCTCPVFTKALATMMHNPSDSLQNSSSTKLHKLRREPPCSCALSGGRPEPPARRWISGGLGVGGWRSRACQIMLPKSKDGKS